MTTVPTADADGQAAIDELVARLDMEQLDDDLFRGSSPELPMRVFGGQVAAQALSATSRTVPADRSVHSLHGYFIRPGDPRSPIIYQVDRTRDGSSFTTRRLTARQHGQTIFSMSASFQLDQPGLEHAIAMPAVPAPQSLPTFAERIEPLGEQLALWAAIRRPFDVRYVSDPPWVPRDGTPRPGAHNQVWFHPAGIVPADPPVQVCLLAYISDLSLLESVLLDHGLTAGAGTVTMASLDHAMWFHRPVDWNQWVLYDSSSPSASGSRGLATGHFFAADGRLLATVVQEGLIRVRS